jgi:hypothetical protein
VSRLSGRFIRVALAATVVPQATAPPTESPGPVARDLALPVILGGVLIVVVALFWGVAMVARRPKDAA